MRLTRRSKYAVRALAELAEAAGGPRRRPCAAGEVARRTRMPEAFVGQILGELARAGLVEGRRGAGGGFRLAVAPEGVSVLDVVEALGGAPWVPEAPSPGPNEPPAVARVWEEARAAMEGVLSRHTIAGIASLEEARPHGDGRGAAFAGPHLSEAEDRRFGRGTGTEKDAALAGPRASAGGEGACRTTTSAGGRRRG